MKARMTKLTAARMIMVVLFRSRAIGGVGGVDGASVDITICPVGVDMVHYGILCWYLICGFLRGIDCDNSIGND